MQRHLGQQTLPTISHHDGVYTLEYVRDFRWKTENAAQQHFLTVTINIKDILGCKLYQSTFGYQKIAHYMIGFLYRDSNGQEKEIMLSTEARRPEGAAYALRKGMLPGVYDIIYIRGTPEDVLSLRTDVWQEPVKEFNFNISQSQTQTLFTFMVHKTNTPVHKWRWYNAITRNCITDLHAGLYKVTGKLDRFTLWAIWSIGYSNYLRRHDVISSNSKIVKSPMSKVHTS